MTELEKLLERIPRASTSVSKYEEVAFFLCRELGIGSVRCKSVGDDKNAANRIREAGSLSSPLVLLLVDPRGVDNVESVVRKTHEIVRPNGLVDAVLVRFEDTEPIHVLVGGSDEIRGRVVRLLPNVRLDSVNPVAVPEPVESWLEGFRAGPVTLAAPILQVDGRPPTRVRTTGDLRNWVATECRVAPERVVVKIITDPKNAYNRVGEALASKPAVLVLLATGTVTREHLRTAGSRRHEASPAPRLLLCFSTPCGSWNVELDEEPNVRIPSPSDEEPVVRVSSVPVVPPPLAPSASVEEPVEPVRPLPPGELRFRINDHVSRLVRHLPLGANSKELYEEQRDATDRGQSIATRAHQFVRELLDEPTTRLIVLTGDAGHGKTHLCRKLLVELCGMTAEAALDALRRDTRGETPFPRVGPGRPIRMVKDLSEIEPPETAATMLARLEADPDSVGVVCANEGRLRAIIDLQPGPLGPVRASLDASVHSGLTTAAPGVHVVNLNHQAVTGGSFFSDLVQRWVHDGRSWATCKSCAAVTLCPIHANRQFLAENGDHAGLPAKRLGDAVRVVEQSGYVLTIRESLMFLAYALVGRYDCPSVHDAWRAKKIDGRPSVPRLVFEPDLQAHELERLRILERLRRIDPGRAAMREVDDDLLRALDEDQAVADELGRGPARSRREARDEQKRLRDLLRNERRRAFFVDDGKSVPFWRRLGLSWYEEFARIADGTGDQRSLLRTRNQLVRGLHVVQGIRPQNDSELFLVDPAFARGRGATSVIATRIPIRYVEVRSQSVDWRTATSGSFVSKSVDWIDRRVVVRLGTADTDVLSLDLRQFEFLMRAAEGVAFRSFHGADVRRISSRLALVVQRRPSDLERIVVMDGHVPRNLSIDVDDSFSVGEM